jgi:hypothetical protein
MRSYLNEAGDNNNISILKTSKDRTVYENKMSHLENKFNIKERNINRTTIQNNRLFEKNNNIKYNIKITKESIKNKKHNKKKLLKYDTNSQLNYKFELRKIWFYTFLNIIGIVAFIYMVLSRS